MNITTKLLAPALLVLAAAPTWAGKSDDMDYGPFLSASYHNTEGKSTLDKAPGSANKGIAVRLGQGGSSAALFDTETVRMVSGWTGGWVKLKGVAFDGGHGPNPSPVDTAEVYFTTLPGPVWSKGGDFADPRTLPVGPGAATVPLGPLPKEWAKYRGLSVNGEKVVFHYTVGTAMLLEHAAEEKVGETTVLTRTFNVAKAGPAAQLIAAALVDGATATTEKGVVMIKQGGKDAGKVTAISVQGLPGASLAVDGDKVVLKLPAFAEGQKFRLAYSKGAEADAGKLLAAAQEAPPAADLKPLTEAGPARWTTPVETKGTLSADATSPYVLDSVEVPFENPWKSWMRIGGLDFFPDGRAAISTWSGDVWIVSGLDAKLEKVTWKRFAGLFHGLGLKIVDGTIHVLGRDQITKLRDTNNDGEADQYVNFNNDVQITPNFHEFAFDLQTDPQGNFYFSKGGPVNPGGRGWGPLSNHHGSIFKISKDGEKFEVFATGVRAPNGMGVGPNGEITTGDNQGTWVPACYINWVKPGGFVSVTDLAHKDPLPTAHSPHICYLPMKVDNSGGGQTWVTSDKWGPMKGRLLHLTYGQSGLLGTMIEGINGVPQGGAFRFPFKFDSGAMRGRFSPTDGQLYVVGLKGWQTNGAKDGSLQRVRYTGRKVYFPEELHVTQAGVEIKFANPLETASASDPQNYNVEQYNYKWTKEYGSPEFKVSNPEEKGRDTLEITGVKLAEDRKTVLLQIPGLKPVDQMEIKLNIKAEDGSEIVKEIVNTINVVPPANAPGKAYVSAIK